MVIRDLKGVAISRAEPTESPGAAERHRRALVEGITDPAMRQSVQGQRRRLVG